MKSVITPKEFKQKMKELSDVVLDDTEAIHGKMDDLLCEVLVQLGYKAGVAIFKDTPKWYA